MALPNDALVNYVFPNNQEVWWNILIVVYPYITGLIAGAFVVSALSHVMKVKEFKRIENFALIMSLCFGLFAGVPLLFHLGQPQRAFTIFFTPHLSSAMSVFGYVYASYMFLLVIEIWLIYRPFFIRRYNETSGLQQKIWYVLTLGVTEYDPRSAALDHRLTVILAGIGIPWAFLLHGYVGFLLAASKAIAWWATPMMPLIFLASAVVSGMAMLFVVYTIIHWWRKSPYDYKMMKVFISYLWGIFALAFAIEMLDVLYIKYEDAHHWSLVGPLIAGPLYNPYIIGQIVICSFVPLFVLGYAVIADVRPGVLLYLSNIGCWLLALQVLLMRYNTVVGGQLISKSERGFTEYHWEFFGREGLLVCILIMIAPFVTYYLLSRVIPIFEEDITKKEERVAG